MAIQLKGLDRVIKKLDKLSNIKTRDIMEEVAEITTKGIQQEAQKFSDTSYMYVNKVEVRDYGTSCFIDVGLSNDNAQFELWKPLWFQHWGFNDYGLNFTGQYYINNHKSWFEEAIAKQEQKALKAIKQKTQAKIREALA